MVFLLEHYLSLGCTGAILGTLFGRSTGEIKGEVDRLRAQLVELREFHDGRARERREQRFDA